MNPLFADTFYFLALLNSSDPAHRKAVGFDVERPQLITTRWVLMEVADALSAPQNRQLFLHLLKTLEHAADVNIIHSDKLFHPAVDLFTRRPDKEWSLTDCASFVVMNDLRLRDALSADRHFEQAGFRSLLR
jgi:predicted nucleic acid-binding protein